MEDPAAALRDGIDHLRLGSLARAFDLFGAAARTAVDPATRSEALRRQADVRRRWAEWEEALRLAAEAVQIARDHALRDHEAAARNVEGSVHMQRGEFARAIQIFSDTLALRPEPLQRGLLAQNLGTTFAQQGEPDRAAEWYAASSLAFAEAGYPREQILALINYGSVQMDLDDLPAAESIFREALRHAWDLAGGDLELQALAEVNLAECLARRGIALSEAFELMLRATGHFVSAGNQPHRVACHRVFGMIAEAQGDLDLAIEALGTGLRLAQEIGSATETARLEREVDRIRRVAAGSTTSTGSST